MRLWHIGHQKRANRPRRDHPHTTILVVIIRLFGIFSLLNEAADFQRSKRLDRSSRVPRFCSHKNRDDQMIAHRRKHHLSVCHKSGFSPALHQKRTVLCQPSTGPTNVNHQHNCIVSSSKSSIIGLSKPGLSGCRFLRKLI